MFLEVVTTKEAGNSTNSALKASALHRSLNTKDDGAQDACSLREGSREIRSNRLMPTLKSR